MPRSLYRPPLHRRIIPWVFAAGFLALAPTLIFYTSGYRINPKKIAIERFGTLIADSRPTGARITLNDQPTRRMTPATIQSLPPGPYRIRFERDGYEPWEKTLDLRPEQVTFADNVRLWRVGETRLVAEGRVLAMESAPAYNATAILLSDGEAAHLRFLRAGIPAERFEPAGLSTGTAPILSWNAAGNAVLIDYERASDGADAWVSSDLFGANRGVLPAGDHVWEGSLIVSHEDGMRVAVNPRRQTTERVALPDGVLAETDAFDLITNTTTGDVLIQPRSILRRLYSLPRTDWRLAGNAGPFTLLRSGDTWLAVRSGGEPEPESAQGARPRWHVSGSTVRGALVHHNELWLWTPGEPPRLLLRRSEPFVDAVWHRHGYHLFVATADRVFALELDDRRGFLITDLVTDLLDIRAISYSDNAIYIAGTKDGIEGLYERVIE